MGSYASVSRGEDRTGRNQTQGGRLTNGHRAASRLAAEIGDDIRRTCPQVAEEYRNGRTVSELVLRYGFDRHYRVSRETAAAAVGNAIGGYSGRNHAPYHGLVGERCEACEQVPPGNRGIGRRRQENAGLREGTGGASAVTDLLLSLHGMIVAHSMALASLRTARAASLGGR